MKEAKEWLENNAGDADHEVIEGKVKDLKESIEPIIKKIGGAGAGGAADEAKEEEDSEDEKHDKL